MSDDAEFDKIIRDFRGLAEKLVQLGIDKERARVSSLLGLKGDQNLDVPVRTRVKTVIPVPTAHGSVSGPVKEILFKMPQSELPATPDKVLERVHAAGYNFTIIQVRDALKGLAHQNVAERVSRGFYVPIRGK